MDERLREGMTAMHDDDPALRDEAGQDRNFVTALARGLEVLRCFRANEVSLSNSDIAQRTAGCHGRRSRG